MKTRKNLYYDESTLDYIQKYKDEHHLPTLTAAIASIVDEHRHRNDIDTTEVVIQHIARRVAELLDDKLTRIRLGVNNADRNSDIIIMLLNTLLGYQELTSLITEDTPQLQRAREIEKERLQNFREKKLDREAKKANKTPEIIPDELIME
jgi:cell division protein ZapA (FtsZ GTPase activity inhibitor)